MRNAVCWYGSDQQGGAEEAFHLYGPLGSDLGRGIWAGSSRGLLKCACGNDRGDNDAAARAIIFTWISPRFCCAGISRFLVASPLVQDLFFLRHDVCAHGLCGNHRSGTAKFLTASESMKALSASSVDGSIITLLHRPSPWSMMISFCVPGPMA